MEDKDLDASRILHKARTLVIHDENSFMLAGEMFIEAKAMIKMMTADWEDSRKSADATKKNILAQRDKHLKIPEKITEILSSKLVEYKQGDGKNMENPKGVSFRKKWAFEIINDAEIPDIFWCVDENKIQLLVDGLGDVCIIPGIRVFETETIVGRT